MKDIYTVVSSALPSNNRVVGFRGSEGLSKPYHFEIFLTAGTEESQDFDMAGAVGARATLAMQREESKPPYVYSGVLSAVELLHETGGRALFRAVLVPLLWQLTQTMHSRIFTGKSVVEVIEDTLVAGGLTSDDFTFKLQGDYKPQEHICQYQESHLDFISRWMEREGLYYYFEQGDDREKLVITDSKSFHEPLRPEAVRYFPQSGADVTSVESFDTFTCRHSSLPASVRLKDYDYMKPTLDVSGAADVASNGHGEIHVYGARFFSPDEGKRLAGVRAQELLAKQTIFHGAGTVFHLRAGYIFEVEDHPRAVMNAEYLATSIEHYGNQGVSTSDLRRLTGLDIDEVYRAEVIAVAAKVQFRAPRATPWPRIYGYENALVDGAADSEYAQIDDQGRYSVKFRFDESDLKDGKASTWVRMLQPHGGGIEGFHFPLRKSTEVLLTFLGGDPDRPVIAGVVPNAHTPSPVTSANHTTNVIQTGGRNRLELEDKSGSQRITLSTPTEASYVRMGAPNEGHNMIIHTDGRTLLDAGNDWDVTVGGHLDERVTGTVYEEYSSSKTEKVEKGPVEETYQSQKTTVTNLREEQFGTRTTHVNKGTQLTHVHGGGSVTDIYDSPHTQTVNATRDVTVTGAVTETYGPLTTVVNGDASTTVHGAWAQKVDSKKHINSGTNWSITHGFATDTWIGLKNSNFIGGQLTVTVAAQIAMALSASATFKMAAEFSLTGGPSLSLYSGTKLAYTGGVSISLSTALSLSVTTASIKQRNLDLKAAVGAKLEQSPINLKNHGAVVIA